jgi:hypothetical protein
MISTYEEFVAYMARRPEHISPLRWAAPLPDSGQVSDWLVRWVREQRATALRESEAS